MARKRLNKKVALIGSVVFLVLGVATVLVVLKLTRSPSKFISDGDSTLKMAQEAKDTATMEEKYDEAAKCYYKAYKLSDSDEQRVELLFQIVDIYQKIDKWQNVMGSWNKIVQAEPGNLGARFGLTKYYYIMADSSNSGSAWHSLNSLISEFIGAVDVNDILHENISQWQASVMPKEELPVKKLGEYLYFARGRARLQMAKHPGMINDPNSILTEAVADLHKALEIEPGNAQIYSYLAEAITTSGEIMARRGYFEEREKSVQRAKKLLEEAVKKLPDNATAHLNLLELKVFMATPSDETVSLESLENEYLQAIEKFPDSAKIYASLARFYPQLGPDRLADALKAVEKALQIAPDNIDYAKSGFNLYYRSACAYNNNEHLQRAIEIAEDALLYPMAQETEGARMTANKYNRTVLYSFLARAYTSQILEAQWSGGEVASKRELLLPEIQRCVHQIEQLYDTGEDPRVIKWRGMLELAKGNKQEGIRKLYQIYQQYEAADTRDAYLCYVLARLFEDTTETGAVVRFFKKAIVAGIGITRPRVYLDYAELATRFDNPIASLNIINKYKAVYGQNQRTNNLQIEAYIKANQLEDAEKLLSKFPVHSPDTIEYNWRLLMAKISQVRLAIRQQELSDTASQTRPSFGQTQPPSQETESDSSLPVLRKELHGYSDALSELTAKMLEVRPEEVETATVIGIVTYFEDIGELNKADNIIGMYLGHFPDNAAVIAYRQILSEGKKIEDLSADRKNEIEKNARMQISDPVERGFSLGSFYIRTNEPNIAIEQFQSVLDLTEEDGIQSTTAKGNQRRFDAAMNIVNLAISQDDWSLAEQMVQLCKANNFDGCEGNYFRAMVSYAQDDYENALSKINTCLKQKPIFSESLVLRSDIQNALGNITESLQDIKEAALLNPLDNLIAFKLAYRLYLRDKGLGDAVSSEQRRETKEAFSRAIRLGPDNTQLLTLYASYISEQDSERAISIMQSLQESNPSLANAMALAQLAINIAMDEKDSAQKEAMLAIAGSSLQWAYQSAPENPRVLEQYAEYLRLVGESEKAEELLTSAKQEPLLWRYYVRSGQLDLARQILEQLYEEKPEDEEVLEGLVAIARRSGNPEMAKKYSEKLVQISDNIVNHLLQIQTFLKLGLIDDAAVKLESVKEKYPDDHRITLLEAWLALSQGKLDEAKEFANNVLETSNKNSIAWQLRGRANLYQANYDRAISDLKKSRALNKTPGVQIILAQAYLRAGRYQDGIIELKEVISASKEAEKARELLVFTYKSLGMGVELQRFYDQTIEDLPDSVVWYHRAAEFAFQTGNMEKAEKLSKQAWQMSLQQGEGNIQALSGYLYTLLTSDKLDKLFSESAKYINGEFAPMAYYRMAQAKMKLGQREQAVQYCRQAMDKTAANEEQANIVLGGVDLLLGREMMAQLCRERLAANPDSQAANWAMYNLMEMEGQYNKALEYIEKARESCEAYGRQYLNYTAEKTRVLQQAYEKTSDNNYLIQAANEYESLLPEMPNNMTVLNNLSYLLATADERLEEALEYIERAYEQRPDNSAILDTYALVLYKNKKYSKAAEMIQASLQQYEKTRDEVPADVYEHLGAIKEALGDSKEALAAYKQAFEKLKSDGASTDAVQKITEAMDRVREQ